MMTGVRHCNLAVRATLFFIKLPGKRRHKLPWWKSRRPPRFVRKYAPSRRALQSEEQEVLRRTYTITRYKDDMMNNSSSCLPRFARRPQDVPICMIPAIRRRTYDGT
ncbi:hypothetical protein HBI16_176090 [Parastagonospora nodorum]|nr:hypothetical protein HBI16_176090 [Parastagonospora nodorum]KAH6406292.1 hypothetical protein HBI14_164580 [Parastagonospora nodorum]KAH6438994.1 hypothetical protein HBI59_152310 [Parastagonospora nodorum]